MGREEEEEEVTVPSFKEAFTEALLTTQVSTQQGQQTTPTPHPPHTVCVCVVQARAPRRQPRKVAKNWFSSPLEEHEAHTTRVATMNKHTTRATRTTHTTRATRNTHTN